MLILGQALSHRVCATDNENGCLEKLKSMCLAGVSQVRQQPEEG